MIKLKDSNGFTVLMHKAEVAHCIKEMGNPPGWYMLVQHVPDNEHIGSNAVGITLCSKTKLFIAPRYSLGSRIRMWVQKTILRHSVGLQAGKEYWVRLTKNEAYGIYVD